MNLRNYQITVRELLENSKARVLLQREFPDVFRSPLLGMAQNMTLQNVLYLADKKIEQKRLDRILTELKKL